MAQAGTSRLGICQTCNTTPARYSCPACSFPSCSLACSTSHKSTFNCTGVAPPVWSKPIQANEMNWGSLMRDQSYIAGVGRAIEDVGRQLVGDKLIPQGRRLGADETVRLDERSDKEDKMVREARNEGVELMLLPKGMSKRVKNATRWDPKKRQLEWMVEVSFQPRPSADRSVPTQPPTVVATVPLPSNKPLQAVLLEAFGVRDKKGKGKSVDPEEATWRLTQREWLESAKEDNVTILEEDEAPIAAEEASPEEVKLDRADPEKVPPGEAEVTELPTDEARSEEAPSKEEDPVEIADANSGKTESVEVKAESSVSRAPRHVSTRAAPSLDDDSPFVLLLAFHSRPVYPDSTPADGTQVQQTPAPAKTSARSVYQLQLTPRLTLRDALAGSTLLENPCFEIWPRETFLRQKLLGKIALVEQPMELRTRERTSGTWDRGRGRGRGRGGASDRGSYQTRGRGRGRGGAGGGSHEPSSRWDDTRSQDSGWGRRGPAEERHGDAKRARTGE
ncbi:hypothetical protein JCM11491_002919 [Sporobolomyces phaffii]